MTETFRFPWMNGGDAFSLSPRDFTPAQSIRMKEAAVEVKRRTALKLRDLEGTALYEELRAEYEELGAIDMVNGFVKEALVMIDPSLKSKPAMEIVEPISMEDFKRLLVAIIPAEAKEDPLVRKHLM